MRDPPRTRLGGTCYYVESGGSTVDFYRGAFTSAHAVKLVQ